MSGIIRKRAAMLLASVLLALPLAAARVQIGYAAEGAPAISAPSAILLEASTGKVIFEQNADQVCSPASITKIMTLLLIFDALDAGKIKLTDEVITSGHAQSMGGSQVYLEEGEDSPAYEVLGTASGSRYFYLDLMVWSLNTLIEDVETYFADIPGGDKVLLQCFRAGSKAGPATIERLLAFNDTEPEEEKPAKTKKSGPKHPSKKKAKNKKKRRK